MKTEVMSFQEFLSGGKQQEKWVCKMDRHFKKYGFIYKVIGSTVIIMVAGGGFDYAFAAGSLDESANRVYYKLVEVGKWIIIFKGGMETIKAAGGGDFDSAKKSFFSYLIIYLLLLGLPYGFNEIDKLFADLKEV